MGVTLVLRPSPEDFRVEEELEYAPDGESGHMYLQVEKRLLTTPQVASLLARSGGVVNRDVGFAGRKDRHGVVTQWFSVPENDATFSVVQQALDTRGEPGFLDREELRLLEAERSSRKLRLGGLVFNRFDVGVAVEPSAEALTEETRVSLDAAAQAINQSGFANAFGWQRFGSGGKNIERGAALLRGERFKGDKTAARFMVSALQSAVFNRVLEDRTAPLDQLRIGDLVWDHRHQNAFTVREDRLAELQERCDQRKVSPTGPIFGKKMLRPGGDVLAEERRAFEALGLSFDELEVPRYLKLFGTRRPLRAFPTEPVVLSWQEAPGFRVRFALPPGTYATVLIEDLVRRSEGVAELLDAGQRGTS